VRPLKTAFDILLVEDDLGDAGLVKIAVRKGVHEVTVHHVKDGAEALSFLRRSGAAHGEAPRPDLMLLDLNLPGRSGHEILDEVKADPELRKIPVVVLSTSEAERDVLRSYELGANSFVSKPMDVEEFTRAIHSIENYWFTVAQLPR
jgi:CheY-like chemotaxis protein